MSRPPLQRQSSKAAASLAVLSNEQVERRIGSGKQRESEHATPLDKLIWQVPCDLLSLDTVDQALALRGIGDYAFVAESAGGLLGRGKFSSVYLARKNDALFAVKHTPLHPHHEQIASRLLREAHILAQLPRHRNLVKAYETIRTPGHFYLVEEFLEGYVNLEAHVLAQPSRRLSPEAASAILDQLVAVVRSAVHSPIRIAHRDIKPENVLLHPQTGHVSIVDFGLSTHFSASEPKLTTVCGSPAYWSPELWLSNYHQRNGSADVVYYWGPDVDIWTIGVCILRLIGGKRFPLGTQHESLESIEERVQERLALVEDVTLRDRLAPLLEMDASKRMQAFADFVIAEEVEEAPLSAYEFKATSFIPGEPTHALVIPLVDPDLPPISRSTSRFSRPSSRRTSPTRSRRTSRSRAASRASSPNRVSSYETLTLLGANDTPMPPSPLRLAFANPHSYSTKRALSFFKYALRCAGVLYRVVPRSEDGETVREYALVLECAATLHSSSTPAQQRLATLRPPLLRSATSRSSSLPPPRPVEEKVKVRCLPFYLGILVRTSQPTPSPPLLDTSPEMRKRRRGKSSRAPSPGAPAGFLVHVSDVRAMELVTEALSVGGEEGRGRSEPAAEELTDKLNSLGLRTGARSRSVPRPSMTA